MGNPYWMGMMMRHAWSLLLFGLGIGMVRDIDSGIDLEEGIYVTTEPTTTTIEDDQMLAEALGITVSLKCVSKSFGKHETPDLQRRKELSPITCGSGFKCDSNSCGSGAKPVPATITNVSKKPGGQVVGDHDAIALQMFNVFLGC